MRGCSLNPSITNYFIQSIRYHFSPNLQNTKTCKPLELETWHFDRIFTTSYGSGVICHVSCVTCHMSRFRCHMSDFFLQNGGDSRWKVCYQRGLPCVVFYIETLLRETHLTFKFFLLCNGEFQCVTRYLRFNTQGVVNNVSKFDMWHCDFFYLDRYHYVIQKIFFTQIHVYILIYTY